MISSFLPISPLSALLMLPNVKVAVMGGALITLPFPQVQHGAPAVVRPAALNKPI